MIKASLNRKLDQALFHLQKLKSIEDDFERECYFASYLAAIKSVLYYIQTWMWNNKRISKKKHFWSLVSRWSHANFSSGEIEQWECITSLRDVDIHEEPVQPTEDKIGSYWPPGYWPPGYWPESYWPSLRTLTIAHPTTKKTYTLTDVCEVSVKITGRLIDEYTTL